MHTPLTAEESNELRALARQLKTKLESRLPPSGSHAANCEPWNSLGALFVAVVEAEFHLGQSDAVSATSANASVLDP